MGNPDKNFQQKPANTEQLSVNDLLSMVYHHVSQFILSSRFDDVYEQEQIEKSKEYLDALKSVLSEPEQLQKINAFIKKIEAIKLDAPKDDEVLDSLEQLLDTNIQSLKTSN